MMFSENEVYGIEDTKSMLKKLIDARGLLWNGITRNVVIAGGFFTSVLQNDKFKDIDIFILNNDVGVYNNLTRNFHIASGLAQAEITEQGEWRRSEMMSYMHNTNILDVINNNRTKAQYILTKYKTREELLSHFDYKHCRVSYVPAEDKLYITRETFDCIKNKILKWNNKQLDNPQQIYRKNKFINTGWVLETPNEPYANLRALSSDQIAAGYQQIKEEMAAKVLGLPSMQQQKSYLDEILDAVTNPTK